MRLSGGSSSGHDVVCQFDPATGSGVIPRALVREALTQEPGAAACTSNCASVVLNRTRSTHVTAGSFDVEVTHLSWIKREQKITD